ncbi:MAG: TIGR00341 family protein [Gammaproteobacteria bacterium]
MRIIEILTDCGHADTIRSIAEQHELLECWIGHGEEETRCSMHLVVQPEKTQTIIDAIQSSLSGSENWRILIKPVEANIPRSEEAEAKEKKYAGTRAREEIYTNVEAGARLDTNYLLLVVFSTIVATIGLIEDNVAVVIGAMVIAPLLGPNIALAFGTALGDRVLIARALKTNLAGMLLALSLALLIGLFWPVNIESRELMARTDVGLDGIVLALVSGAAAILSLTTGLSSALVGVMVAVAILPPTATLGLMTASGNFHLAMGAGLLLAVNVVCVNLSAKLVLLLKGVKPRTWLEKTKARQSMLAYISFWVIILATLVAAMHIYHTYFIRS